MIGPLTAAMAQLCDNAASNLSGTGAETVAALRRRLDEPLRLAVAGRVKAGKSTLVNALVGRRVARTAQTECTRVVTQFRYAPDERYEVVARSGATTVHRLPADGLPEAFPLPPEDISRVDLWLSSEPLRTCTVIDTPGLSSTNTHVSARTGALLGVGLDQDSRQAVRAAEAVLFVLTHDVRTDERQVLDSFRALCGAALSGDAGSRDAGRDDALIGPANALAVLTKADLLAETAGRGMSDPWQAARDLAARCADSLGDTVATVVPVAGLLAESVRAGRLGEADAAALRRLAAVEPSTLRLLLLSADRFHAADAPVDGPTRRRLVARLGLNGLRLALAAVAAGRTSSAQLLAELGEASGFAAVAAGVDAVFRRRADAIKASAALAVLRSLARSAGLETDEAEWLRDELELVSLDPAMHTLEELDAAADVLAGRVHLPDELAAEVARFAARTGPADKLGRPDTPTPELAHAALAGAQRWRGVANGMPPPEARIASIMHRAHHLLWEQLASRPGTVTSTKTGS